MKDFKKALLYFAIATAFIYVLTSLIAAIFLIIKEFSYV